MILTNLINSFVDGGTGSVLLYYDCQSTGENGGDEFIQNVAPSSTVGSYNAVLQLGNIVDSFENEKSGFNLATSHFEIDPFAANLISPDAVDTELTFLFSFEKTHTDAGILFGSLVREEYSDGTPYGRGFNIGVNSRNQMFFQGINADDGEYVLTANEIELSNKNICSVTVSPYNVTMARYQLSDDDYEEQSLSPNGWFVTPTGSYFLGASPTFYRGASKTFSGYVDQFLVMSGVQPSADLKAIASGFVATGIESSGATFVDTVITGSEITLILRSGVTGFQPVITGYEQTFSTQEFIEFVLVEESTPLNRADGERFFTGYALPNSFGGYLEETSFLIETNDYQTTGNNAFATLGLSDQTGLVTRYTLTSNRVVSLTGVIPLYEMQPITGALLDEPTGYEKTYLTQQVERTGVLAENLSLKDDYIHQYKPDFLYYLYKR